VSNYVKNTDYAVKDGLLSGNPNKIIKGTELDEEFNDIATAISTKADLVSPTFIGTPAAPTASPGTNTTQVATTAFVTAADIAERTATATLTNKTLTSPAINTPTITGGSISGITDLAVADGGTGVSALTADNVILGDGTNPVKFVAPGTNGNVLTSNGTTWVSAASSKILQIVQTRKTDTFSSNSNSYVDVTNLSVSITPSSVTSKFLIFCNLGINATNQNGGAPQILRNSTAIGLADSAGSRGRSSFAGNGHANTNAGSGEIIQGISSIILDSPNTTSLVTYKVQVFPNGSDLYVNRTVTDQDQNTRTRCVSDITVMEIAA
jgi:hypothetical protein